MNDESLTRETLEQDTKTALLRAGTRKDDAERLARAITEHLFRQRNGTRTYWTKGPKRDLPMTEEARRRVFREWWVHRTGVEICLKEGISRTTLNSILAEGRKKGWAPK